MIPIKFRAWDKTTKDWYDDNNQHLAILPNGQIYNCWNGELMDDYTDKVIIIRYTGIKDKYGKDVYEGDIYKYKWWHDAVKFEYRYEKVEWETRDIAYEGQFHGYDLDSEHMEVVGNIYENPELLEVSK